MWARGGPSQKVTDRRPSKKLRCEKKTITKLEVQQGVVRERTTHSFPSKEPAKKSSQESGLLDLKTMLQSETKRVPKTGDGLERNPTNLCVEASTLGTTEVTFPKTDSCAILRLPFPEEEEEEEEEGGQGADLSDDSEMEPEEVVNPGFEVDNSVFLNEDSNQPLPMDRFFGSVAFMQVQWAEGKKAKIKAASLDGVFGSALGVMVPPNIPGFLFWEGPPGSSPHPGCCQPARIQESPLRSQR